MKISKVCIYFTLLFVTLFSCEKNRLFHVSQIYGEWKIKSGVMETGEVLIFNTDKTFTYKSVYHITEFFSQGNWKIKEDTLILNSIMPHECFYLLSFGGKCKSSDVLTDELIYKTNLECESPASNKFFIEFKNSKFLIKKDSLIHIPANKNCDEVPEKIILHR